MVTFFLSTFGWLFVLFGAPPLPTHPSGKAAPAPKAKPSTHPSMQRVTSPTKRTPLPTNQRSNPTAFGPSSQPTRPRFDQAMRKLLAPYGLPASPTTPTKTTPNAPPKIHSVTGNSLFWIQTLGTLLGVCIVVLAAYVCLRWLSGQMHLPGAQSHGLLRVYDRASLEPRKGLLLIEAAGRYILVATHDQGVTLLREFDASEIQQAEQALQEQPPSSFWQKLRGRNTTRDSAAAVTSAAIPTEFEVISDGQKVSPKPPTEDARTSENLPNRGEKS